MGTLTLWRSMLPGNLVEASGGRFLHCLAFMGLMVAAKWTATVDYRSLQHQLDYKAAFVPQCLILNKTYISRGTHIQVAGDIRTCQQAVVIGGEILCNLLYRVRRCVGSTSAAENWSVGMFPGKRKLDVLLSGYDVWRRASRGRRTNQNVVGKLTIPGIGTRARQTSLINPLPSREWEMSCACVCFSKLR